MDRLLSAVEAVDTRGDLSATDITSIELDSRIVRAGALFCCVPGRRFDGHDFAADALGAGATALLVERPLPLPAPQIVVAPGTARSAMADLSRAFYGDPAGSLVTVGVTGTNGKTTVTHLLASILDTHGLPCAVIGTLGGARTTPEAPALQALLAEARDSGRGAVAMEVSSHALSEHRVEGVHFAMAVFTNLSHEHLDYHGTMEQYFAAKAELFTPRYSAQGVVNADDPWGRRLVDGAALPITPFGRDDATDVVVSGGETMFTWRGVRVHLKLRGTYHVINALAAATAAADLGVPVDVVAEGLARAEPVPGRFEVVEVPAPFTVVVDYAHTPDGLRHALASARALAGSARVLCVFGCGGDRDRDKRPQMGAVAEAGADVVVVTSDNPRREDPQAIINAVLAGMNDPSAERVMVEPDRRSAIAKAVDAARSGDVVVVAGKGHERTIEVAGQFLPFEDKVEAAAAVANRTDGRRS
ncbi:MAG TPA: UDP-N-acetylmuramoyl-L-alanyl-D-glutamate--2,6-diaminopimelate ligase [Acidimicrobiales bacterium]|nr:UDP-N-acetylmuramoyl-L-alanyl-D-glutamate--2,6-diaminopimelate ligase [Acidimicrobiales bacterium]